MVGMGSRRGALRTGGWGPAGGKQGGKEEAVSGCFSPGSEIRAGPAFHPSAEPGEGSVLGVDSGPAPAPHPRVTGLGSLGLEVFRMRKTGTCMVGTEHSWFALAAAHVSRLQASHLGRGCFLLLGPRLVPCPWGISWAASRVMATSIRLPCRPPAPTLSSSDTSSGCTCLAGGKRLVGPGCGQMRVRAQAGRGCPHARGSSGGHDCRRRGRKKLSQGPVFLCASPNPGPVVLIPSPGLGAGLGHICKWDGHTGPEAQASHGSLCGPGQVMKSLSLGFPTGHSPWSGAA